MVKVGAVHCPKCNGELKHYDTIVRKLRTKYGERYFVTINRLRCCRCYSIHRELPLQVVPWARYELDIIEGVLRGYITSTTLGFEDYPCERTMQRWFAKFATPIMETKKKRIES